MLLSMSFFVRSVDTASLQCIILIASALLSQFSVLVMLFRIFVLIPVIIPLSPPRGYKSTQKPWSFTRRWSMF